MLYTPFPRDVALEPDLEGNAGVDAGTPVPRTSRLK
jgi:hypothetical protein